MNQTNKLPHAKWACKFLFMANGLAYGSIVSRMPAIKNQTDLNEAQLGQALLGLGLGALISFPVAGVILRSIGSRYMALITTCMLLISLLIAGVANSWLTLMIPFCLFGFSMGAMEVAMGVQAINLERLIQKPCMSTLFAMASVGGMIGAGSTFIFSDLEPIKHFSILMVSGLILLGISLPYLVPDPEKVEAEEENHGFKMPPKALFGIGILALCAMVSEGAIADWGALLLSSEKGASEAVAALGYAAFSAVMIFGRLFGDRFREKISDVSLVRVLASIATVGMALVLFCESPAMAIIGFAVVGLGLSVVSPIMFNAAGNQPGVEPAIGVASISTLGYGGMLAGPPLIGLLANNTGLGTALLVVLGLCVLLLLKASWVCGATKNAPLTL
ncbi:MFS transporter [Hahella aquimaris]|uniref:MFS transporter n=1 Tax=Hahella sp. HNIBRBA332 TaxID=3015983 RepID=UPI00273BFF8B|nr:MFS transporter [Hahella sp. HNIBRBA332]WLQ15857.1 MFS transporter [Hahella sp. HNIBRBA332]